MSTIPEPLRGLPVTARALRSLLAAALALPLAIGAAACGSATPEPEPPPPPTELSAGPWTRAFLEPANLIADEILIEGPPGLRYHISVRQESASTAYTAKTTAKGFLQEVAARADAGYVELHATLDTWELVAFRRIRWLERPGDAPVVVRAVGSATFQAVEGGETRRDELLEFRGDVPR
jgi:hypothetical protein